MDEHCTMYIPFREDIYTLNDSKKSLAEKYPELLETDPDYFKEDG
ncbi:hypothetical protein KDW_31040 [Dictyobacter vulcani]|uniref:Uncharacterized protein n=1 Tax=Dictyobacter vulcani TaxID=2607529 RepID=A0A5J4KP70_9CHLR|nr:hypothetical protein KDW_31040 [Dictyobacter vulcani]